MAESHMSDVMDELRKAYLKSLAEKMAALAEAVNARNYTVVTRLGHQLKGSGSSYGLPEVSELGARIEQAGENRLTCEMNSVLADFTILLNRISVNHNPPERA